MFIQQGRRGAFALDEDDLWQFAIGVRPRQNRVVLCNVPDLPLFRSPISEFSKEDAAVLVVITPSDSCFCQRTEESLLRIRSVAVDVRAYEPERRACH